MAVVTNKELDPAIMVAVSDDKLLQRVISDVFQLLMKPVVGLPVGDAIVALNQLREKLEKVNHDRQQLPKLRVPGWRPRKD